MSHIDVRARHSMSEEDAQVAADELAGDLARKFDIDYGWDGDHIHFERSGVHGMITVRENEIRIKAVLGLMLIFLKPRIEEEIVDYLETHFGCSFD
jgi:putative polyhydroxyalkanoate system protein